ncbi:hypothetical protein ANAPC5_01230 [Anaplasma phagocytophilum]|nr:hypothetical protein ANAPC5_01230 [Anaplasma phagocytophilum]
MGVDNRDVYRVGSGGPFGFGGADLSCYTTLLVGICVAALRRRQSVLEGENEREEGMRIAMLRTKKLRGWGRSESRLRDLEGVQMEVQPRPMRRNQVEKVQRCHRVKRQRPSKFENE